MHVLANGHRQEPAGGSSPSSPGPSSWPRNRRSPRDGGKSKPSSLFDWALTLEQEREKEPVGAGR